MTSTSHSLIWVSRAPSTGQLSIYDTKSYRRIATWGSKYPIKKLLYNAAEDIVVAMTKGDVHVFSAHDCTCTKGLTPILSHPILDSFTEVTLVRATKKGNEVDLWYSVQSKLKAMKISVDGTTDMTFHQYAGSSVTCMAPMNETEGNAVQVVIVSHGSCVERWNADNKKLLQLLNCSELIWGKCECMHCIFLMPTFMLAPQMKASFSNFLHKLHVVFLEGIICPITCTCS